MHTLQLKIDDSIVERFMGLLEKLPKDKIAIISKQEENAISFEEAKAKVQNALNHIALNKGIPVDDAFDKVLNS